jgi:hypothetical protein
VSATSGAASRAPKQPNALSFPAREALHRILGVDLTQIDGLGPYLQIPAPAFAARSATDPGFIDFNVLAGPAAHHLIRPSRRGACKGFETPSQSAADQAEAARPTCRVSGWTHTR